MISLSRNVLCEIFSFLTPKELCVLGSTCRRFRAVSETEQLWSSSSDHGTGSQRKKIFSLRGRRTQNIFNNLKQTFILSGHNRTINSVRVKGNKVLTASEDSSVRLFNIKKSKGSKIISHIDSATSAQFWDEGIVSVSADRTLKVFQKEAGIKSITAHRQGITKLKSIDVRKVATSSYDGSVKIWDLNSFKELFSCQDFAKDVSVLETCDNYFASASLMDNTICLRDLQRPDFLQKFEIQNQVRPGRIVPNLGCVKSILLTPPLLYTGETDKLRIWDMRTPSLLVQTSVSSIPFNYENRSGIFKIILNEPNQLLIGSNGLMGVVEFDLRTYREMYYPVHDYQILTMCQGTSILNNIVVTSGSTKSFRYEISVHQCSDLQKSTKFIPGHKGVINSIHIGDDCIASGGKDGSVRVLSFNKPKEALRLQSKTISISS